MGFLYWALVIYVYTFMDKAVAFLNQFVDVGYYSLWNMYEEYYKHSQDLTGIIFRKDTAWQVIPLCLAFYATPTVRGFLRNI